MIIHLQFLLFSSLPWLLSLLDNLSKEKDHSKDVIGYGLMNQRGQRYQLQASSPIDKLHTKTTWTSCILDILYLTCKMKWMSNMNYGINECSLIMNTDLCARTADSCSNISWTKSGSIQSLSTLHDNLECFLPNIALNTPLPCFLCGGFGTTFSGGKISTTIQVVSSRSPSTRTAS